MNYFNNNKKLSVAMLAILSSMACQNATAAGFALIEAGASGLGNAYAGASAHTMDASVLFFNPAGMMDLKGDHLVLAGHFITPNSEFNNDGSAASALVGGAPLSGAEGDGGFDAFVPDLFWVKTLDQNTKFGLAVFPSFGSATKYDDDWIGRYHGVASDLKIININPSIAYRVNDKLSVAGGVDIMIGSVTLTSAIDFGAICVASLTPTVCAGLGSLPQNADGFVELSGDNGDDITIGFNLGATYKLSDDTNLGFAYRSAVDMKMGGDADFTVPSSSSFVYGSDLFLDSEITAEVGLPASMSFSVSHKIDKVTYLADLTWTGWSSFDELRVKYDNASQPDSATTEDWNDVMRYSFGADYQYSDKMVIRAGLALDESPTPSTERRTVRLPGADRTWISMGMSYKLDNAMSFDLGFAHLMIDDGPIDNEFESSVPTLAATVTGEYQASVNIISAQFNWKY